MTPYTIRDTIRFTMKGMVHMTGEQLRGLRVTLGLDHAGMAQAMRNFHQFNITPPPTAELVEEWEGHGPLCLAIRTACQAVASKRDLMLRPDGTWGKVERLTGDQLREMREGLGWSQEVMANALGTDQPRICEWERQGPEGCMSMMASQAVRYICDHELQARATMSQEG